MFNDLLSIYIHLLHYLLYFFPCSITNKVSHLNTKMSRKSKVLYSSEGIMECILELDVSEAESDSLECDVTNDCENDRKCLPEDIE